MARFGFVSIALLLVVGCGVTGLPFRRVSYRIATANGPHHLALTEGQLDGQTNQDGTACLWLGTGFDRIALVWPPGYQATGSPLTVYRPDGAKVATVGNEVQLGGGFLPDGSQVLGCAGLTRAWFVDEVEKAGG